LHRERLKVEADPARTRGNPAAPVVLVEFADFQCPYCRKQEPILASLLQRYAGKLAIAYRDDPVAELHPKAALAASAAQCAAAQQQFWPYYQKLVAGDLDAASLNRYADELALDQPRFAACLAAPETAAAVEADRQRALELGVAGTPTFFLNGIRLIGAQTEEAFARAIDRELAQPRP
jgi:protein-disulfide isomerase